MTLNLAFGALAEPLAKQLAKAQVVIEKNDLMRLQRDADALVRVHIGGLLTDSELRRARKKLMKKILKAARPA
jgi:hypothetical protein